MQTKPLPWYWSSVAYQIYPRSFYDSNDDGIGDLAGITQKLDYLKDLGIGVIWLSPFYPSPMADFGYDVADFEGVDPIFGTIDDFKQLLAAAHDRDIRIIVDFVPNHSSDEHAWFIESRSSRDNPKRDWYIWQDAKPDGSEPNNWQSVFGGSVWEWDATTEQYYMHSFDVKQPDLNWQNPEVQEAMCDAMRFWLELGVDGFRVDAVYWMSKHPDWQDDPEGEKFVHNQKGPELFTYLKFLADTVADYPDRFMVTEAYPDFHDSVNGYLEFYVNLPNRVVAPFNFEGISRHWKRDELGKFIEEFQAALKPDYLPVYVLGNHDKPRLSSRIGAEAARAAALMELTLPGLPFVYYGEELGMKDGVIPPDKVHDPQAIGRPEDDDGRDPERTPMQWSAEPNAGFSKVEPWLPVSSDYQTVNVEAESKDPDSFLSLYKSLIAYRNDSPTLQAGSFTPLETKNPQVFAYQREGDDKLAVFVNFSAKEQAVKSGVRTGEVLLTSLPDMQTGNIELADFKLPPHGAFLAKIS